MVALSNNILQIPGRTFPKKLDVLAETHRLTRIVEYFYSLLFLLMTCGYFLDIVNAIENSDSYPRMYGYGLVLLMVASFLAMLRSIYLARFHEVIFLEDDYHISLVRSRFGKISEKIYPAKEFYKFENRINKRGLMTLAIFFALVFSRL